MDKYDWASEIEKVDPDWSPKGVNTQVLEETKEADQKLFNTDPERSLDQLYTLNYFLNEGFGFTQN